MLRVKQLSVHYGSFRALDDVSFDVSLTGGLHGVIGPNGKSTLMDALTGRRQPTRGKVYIDGNEVMHKSMQWRRRHGMSRSFQRTSIFPGHTVREQLSLAASRVLEADVDSIADVMGLRDVYDVCVDSIAYGDQRRVDIALALLGKPRIMLLDEPAAGLTGKETVALFEHLTDLVRERNLTAIVVGHDVDAVFRFCNTITALDLGRVLLTGAPDEVRRDQRVVSWERGMTFLAVRNLRAGYGQAVIVRDLDLDVDSGESVAVIGRNGAGKSTLLNTFFGRTTLFGGAIEVDGRPLHGRPGYLAPSLGLTISPQGRHILPHLSVEENLRLGSAAQRRGNWTLERVYDLFPILQERRAQPGTAMSGGQQQMLAIGRALMGNPLVLLLDEPTEGLSPKLIDDLAAVIKIIVKSGTGVLLVEQHLNLLRRVSDRFVVMSKGEIVDRGRVDQIDDEKHRASISFQ